MEAIAKIITVYISHTLEIMAALVIAVALLQLLYNFLTAAAGRTKIITAAMMRVKFGSAVAVALELLLGADVLATAVAPSWNDIGMLAAIATIRTILNYFLEKELKHMQQMHLIADK